MVLRESIHVYNTCTIGLNGRFAETRISIRTYHLISWFFVFKILSRKIKNSYLAHLHVFTHICTCTYKGNERRLEWPFLNRIIVTYWWHKLSRGDMFPDCRSLYFYIITKPRKPMVNTHKKKKKKEKKKKIQQNAKWFANFCFHFEGNE